MRRNTFWSWAYWILGAWQWVAGVLSAMITAMLRADAAWYAERWRAAAKVIEYGQTVAPLVVPMLILTLGLANVLRR